MRNNSAFFLCDVIELQIKISSVILGLLLLLSLSVDEEEDEEEEEEEGAEEDAAQPRVTPFEKQKVEVFTSIFRNDFLPSPVTYSIASCGTTIHVTSSRS